MTYEFRLIRFNPRRAMRRAPAAKVLCTEDGNDIDLLWMSERVLKRNIEAFGPHPELLKAQAYYHSREEFPQATV